MIGIYRIYHKKSGKSYVGKSVDVEDRIRQHFNNEDRSYSIRGAIDKHGSDAFAWEILEVCCKENLDFRECHWIAALDCIAPNGYNLTAGGDGGIPTAEVRQKMSESAKRRCQDKAYLQKMSDVQKGKKLSDATRRKISESHKGRVFSESHKRQLSKSVPSGENHHLYRHDLRENVKQLHAYYIQSGSYRAVARKFKTAPLLAQQLIKEYLSELENE